MVEDGQATGVRLSRSASALFLRFTELGTEDQLRTYQAINEYLAARNFGVRPDRQLEAQLGSVVAIRRVAEHLGLDDPTDLRVNAFNSAPSDVRDGWTAARVIKAHGTWRAAREVAAGDRAVPTARQQSVKRGRPMKKMRSDDYVAAVREWLATEPPRLGTLDYDQWARERNETRPEGTLRVPGYGAISTALPLRWRDLIEVARGELTLADALKKPRVGRWAAGGSGLFVSSTDIAAITGKPFGATRVLVERDDFPACVLLYDSARYWLRSDVEAYLNGKPFPKRTVNELNGKYVGVREAARIVGLSHHGLRALRGCPEPTYRSGRTLWLKSDIEAWRDQRQRDDVGRGHWKRKKG